MGAAQRLTPAQSQFCRRYETVVHGFLSQRWLGTAMAEWIPDAVQEVFLACLKPGGALERLDPELGGDVRGYLFGVSRNVARSFERRCARPAPDVLDEPRPVTETPSVIFDREWARALTGVAMRTLIARSSSKLQRFECVFLRKRFLEDQMPREIAARFPGFTARKVSKLIERGRARFLEALLDTLRAEEPHASRDQLEQRCHELLELL